MWQSAARRRLFDIFPLIYWGLRIRICETMENARIAAERSGRVPSLHVGEKSKEARAWRALGRTLCDIQLLVFNIGRADFRNKFVEPFTVMIQTSSSNAMGLQGAGLAASVDMIRATAALVDARGIILILERVLAAATGARAARVLGAEVLSPNVQLKQY